MTTPLIGEPRFDPLHLQRNNDLRVALCGETMEHGDSWALRQSCPRCFTLYAQCDGYAGDAGASAPRCESYIGHPGRHFVRSILQDERESSLGRDAEGHLVLTLGPGAESPSRKGGRADLKGLSPLEAWNEDANR